MGDPAGVGPEIVVKALSDPALYKICRPMVLGDHGAIAAWLNKGDICSIREISHPLQASGTAGQIDLIPVCRLNSDCLVPGLPSTEGGAAMVECILAAVDMALQQKIAAMVTCPISKVLMQQAGYPYEGHTRLIAERTGTRDYVMMLAGEKLRVALVTIHCALKDVPFLIQREGILKTIAVTYKALAQDFALKTPRIALAGLNPHAGEEGLFGKEEAEIIEPAVREAVRRGYSVQGPFPPDTIFHRAVSGNFDAVIAMYHDQGLIPLKLLHFSDAINVTLGLPIIRTSVDHGTAYDIAGKGAADPSSLKAAVRMAVMMARNRLNAEP
ncbi:MAG: 4-hydroxythreonine-4-phosphate dehydrogenase PdxA [Deltaproteobacteria bacterium]|nr:4-hydroxythreonine-4-phosphate dehydrogenase PdxA [Deltaproteobacteria bacterium]